MHYRKTFVIIVYFLTLFTWWPLSVWAKESGSNQGTVSLNNPLTGEPTNVPPEQIIGNVINAVLGVVGSLALLMFIYGGLVWMTSSGNSEKVQKGKNILIWATLGLVVIFASYALVNFVLTDVINAPNAG